MAQKLKGTNGAAPAASSPPPAGHNASAAFPETLRKGFEKLWRLDREIKAEVAEHITPMREERSEAWKNLRNDLGMKAADLKPLYALYKRDQEVRELDEEDEQRQSQEKIRKAFDTLRTGETLNFLGVVGAGGADRPVRSEAHTDPDRRDELVESGRAAYKAGGRREDCPWPADSEPRKAWIEGFELEQAATAAEMHPETGSSEPDERRPGQPPRARRRTEPVSADA